jgi:hypothetical protein
VLPELVQPVIMGFFHDAEVLEIRHNPIQCRLVRVPPEGCCAFYFSYEWLQCGYGCLAGSGDVNWRLIQ